MEATPTCPRHPDTETRLRCSACDTLICPDCAVEAAVGYKCPDCGRQERAGASPAATTSGGWRSRAGRSGDAAPRRSSETDGSQLPLSTAARGTGIGALASGFGGLLLGPILAQGMLSLISAGVIGWGVARAVYWATDERNSPYVRALALTAAGIAVVIGIATAQAFHGGTREPFFLMLAYPAALYGGWIVVRQR